jgi:hypothetical protein
MAVAGTDEIPDRLLTQLYGDDPADFVARRTAVVKELRAQGQPDLARSVAALRRPTVSVWAVNRLHDVAPTEVEALTEAGVSLRDAQMAALAGEAVSDLRSLLSAHSAALQRTVDAATAFLAGQGQGVSDVVRQRLQTTLRAVSLGPPELREALATGRLMAELEPAGFGAFEGIELAGPRPPRPERPARPPTGPDAGMVARAKEARAAADAQARVARDAQQEAQALRARAQRLAAEAEEAAAQADAAEARARAAAEQAEAMEREATRAEGSAPE